LDIIIIYTIGAVLAITIINCYNWFQLSIFSSFTILWVYLYKIWSVLQCMKLIALMHI